MNVPSCDRPSEPRSIFSGIGLERFKAEHFRQAPFAFDSPDPFWLDTVGIDQVDELVASLTVPDPNWIFVVKNGISIDHAKLTTGNGYIDLRAVYQAYAAGYSLQLAKVHRRLKSIGLLARSLEAELLRHEIVLVREISGHVYLTPPNSTGLAPHYDNHDVLILQLEGVKNWRLYGEDEKSPTARQTRLRTRDEIPPLVLEVAAKPGNVLYIPRGFYHEATAGESHSLHLTFSVCTLTWLDIVLPLLNAQPGLRAATPPLDLADPDLAKTASLHLARALAETVEPGAIAERMSAAVRNAWSDMDLLPDAGFRNILASGAIDSTSRLRRGSGAEARIETGEGEAKLSFAGNEIAMPDRAAKLFDFLQASDSFAVGEMPDVVASETKVALAKNLVRAGFLRLA